MNYKQRIQALSELHILLSGKERVVEERLSQVLNLESHFNRDWENMKTEKAYGTLKKHIEKQVKEMGEEIKDVIEAVDKRMEKLQHAYDNELSAYQHLSYHISEMDLVKRVQKKQETLQKIRGLNCDQGVRDEITRRCHINNI